MYTYITGRQKNFSSIPGKDNRVMCSPKRQYQLKHTPSLLFRGWAGNFNGENQQGSETVNSPASNAEFKK
jgi:hypothetical protein